MDSQVASELGELLIIGTIALDPREFDKFTDRGVCEAQFTNQHAQRIWRIVEVCDRFRDDPLFLIYMQGDKELTAYCDKATDLCSEPA